MFYTDFCLLDDCVYMSSQIPCLFQGCHNLASTICRIWHWNHGQGDYLGCERGIIIRGNPEKEGISIQGGIIFLYITKVTGSHVHGIFGRLLSEDIMTLYPGDGSLHPTLPFISFTASICQVRDFVYLLSHPSVLYTHKGAAFSMDAMHCCNIGASDQRGRDVQHSPRDQICQEAFHPNLHG